MKIQHGNSYRGESLNEYISVVIIPMQYDNKRIVSRVAKNGKQYSFKIINSKVKDVKKIGILVQNFVEQMEI